MDDLNKEQIKAVTHGTGPQLVIAGAGTGKTTVITRRIAWLISQKKIAPSAILALTFTDKAAGEMETRVDKLVPYGFVDTWIHTFHAFGDRILRDHALEIGLSPDFQVLNQPEQAVFLRERIFDIELEHLRPLSSPHKYIGAIVEHINRLKDNLVTPEKYLCFAEKFLGDAKDKEDESLGQTYLELAQIFKCYNKWMAANDSIDFGDQIALTIKLLKEHSHILKDVRNQFQYCLVDEFQDTNIAQNELLKLLFGRSTKRQNITAVGDDDQSIYGFRGAAVQNILDFQKNWPQCNTVVLRKNYRSSQPILDSAYDLITNNNPNRLEIKAGIDKKLIGTGAGESPQFLRYDDDFNEAKSIVDNIKKLITNSKKYSDIAILVRANNQLDPIIHQLRAAGLPYIAPGSSGLYDEPIIRLLISFVKVIANYEDHISLYYLATSEVYGVDTTAMTAISSYIRYKNLHFRTVLENIDDYPELKKRMGDEKEKIAKLIEDIKNYTEFARTHNVGELIYRWLDKTGLLKTLIKRSEKDILAQVELENIAAFYEKIKDFVRASENANVIGFVDNLRLLVEAGENPALSRIDIDVNAITLMTVHSAKGLEWPIVFMPTLAADRFPARHRTNALPVPQELTGPTADRDTHVQEERRLFYVAMTRAKEKVILSVARRYDRGVREKKISQFVFEALGTEVNKIPDVKKMEIIEKLSLFDIGKKQVPRVTKFIKPDAIRLNPHQIDDYITCPKKFVYIHILEVPITTKWEVAYGTVIHKAIGFYFARCLQGKAPSLDEVLDIYHKSWQPEGFTTHEHEIRKKRVGEQALRDFYEREQKHVREITAVEYPFEFKLDGIKIRGRFDTVFGKGDKKEIIDFKTSDVKELDKAKERVKQSTQMQIYAMANITIEKNRPQTALYFVESGVIGQHQFTDKELEKTKEKIRKVAEGLKKEEFHATPGYNQCHWCAYKDICPYKYKNS